MVCLACLLPIFLIPIVNILPILFHFIMGKLYALLGWEYKRPERTPPACPYKPVVKKMDSASSENETLASEKPNENSRKAGLILEH